MVDFDLKPGYLGVCCEDSTLRIYKLQSPTDTKAKYVLGNLTKNQPSALAISPSGNTLYVAGTQDLQIHMFRVQNSNSKLTLEPEKVFAKKHTMKISSIAYTPTCIVSCGEEEDIMIYMWSHSGEILASHENKQLRHKKLSISQDCKFFTIAAWLGSARIFEITKEKKTDKFSGVHVVMELGGHSQGLSAVSFNSNSSLAVTCSHDSTVKLWNINVQYEFKEKPVLLKTLNLGNEVPSACAVSDKQVILGLSNSLRIYSIPDFELVDSIEDAHTQPIRKIEAFGNVLMSSSLDSKIHLWHLD